uniref:Kinetochore protein NDC80 n=1 Tax=Rhizophora mucronata TaxID=61149 RepID=A0A2P2IXT5_RHIMU
MRGTSRRRPTDSFNPQSTLEHRQFQFNTSRDSDASFASSRPSSVGAGRSSVAFDLPNDRTHQAAAVRAINAYLSSHSSLLSLRTHPISSSREIVETLQFLLHQLDYPVTKLEEDLFIILKSLNCPFKVTKSNLRAPNTPHNWPSYLAVIHWLVQIAKYKEHLGANPRSVVENNDMLMYALDSYLSYIRGDDDQVDALDKEFLEKLNKDRNSLLEGDRQLERSFSELKAKAEELRSGPTEREKLEKERSVLEEDVKKFHAMIAEFNQRTEMMEKVLGDKRKELEVKVEEKKRIDMENEELKKRVEEQTVNARDAERMKRELLAVERDIGEAEAARNAWEEKTWDLDTAMGQKFKELEALAMECNQAARRLKLGDGFQYVLNGKGSSPAEVMGIDYKSTIKLGLQSFADEIKKSSMEKLEELILLQQQSSELSSKIEGKKNNVAALQSQIDEVEAQLDSLRKEMEEYVNRCDTEGKRMVEDVQIEGHNLEILEREAADVIKVWVSSLFL